MKPAIKLTLRELTDLALYIPLEYKATILARFDRRRRLRQGDIEVITIPCPLCQKYDRCRVCPFSLHVGKDFYECKPVHIIGYLWHKIRQLPEMKDTPGRPFMMHRDEVFLQYPTPQLNWGIKQLKRLLSKVVFWLSESEKGLVLELNQPKKHNETLFNYIRDISFIE